MATVRDELIEWLVAQDSWQQDIARRLIDRPSLQGEELAEALRVVRSAFGALEPDEVAVQPTTLAPTEVPEAAEGAGAPRLLAFGRMRGVGAVAADQELTFAPDGLTVIYGQNAAGKSTYVRGLKRICRTVDCDAALLGNVFAPPGQDPPTAKVEVRLEGEPVSRQVSLAQPEETGLDAVSVFDARCAELYVDNRNAVAFVPSALLLLTRLASTQDAMRKELQAEENELIARLPKFPEFQSPSTPKRFIEQLNAESDAEEARRLSQLDEKEGARLTELRAAFASAAAPSARADAESARHDNAQATALAKQLGNLEQAVSPATAAAINARATEARAAEGAVALARHEFETLPVAGVGSEPWRNLWEAARRFLEADAAPFPPQAGSSCPLCLQEIPAETAQRLQHFEEHVRGDVQEQARVTNQALETALQPLDPHRIDACRTPFLGSLKEREPKLHELIDSYLDAVSERMQSLRSDSLSEEHPAAASPPVAELEEWARAREAHAETLLAASEPTKQLLLREELDDLEAREQLAVRLDQVETAVGLHKRIAALRRAHSALATNRITAAQRRLSESAVTQALSDKLREELNNLRCGHLAVDLAPYAAVGEMQVELRLAGAHGAPRVSDIASEGEQRALSLSFFLAEVATSESDGGIIVDDPVSSLDDERREYIAKRLIEETRQRQVIVLTHDLPFMLDLVDNARAAELPTTIQAVWRLGDQIGRVDDHPPFKAMNLRERVGVLSQQVEQWDKQPPPVDFDDAWRRVCDFYARLRITWERAVEERLFRGVVQRFQREVKTLKLDDVVITPELVGAVKEGVTRCSLFVHDEPPATSATLPGRIQLAGDLEKIREFEKSTRSSG